MDVGLFSPDKDHLLKYLSFAAPFLKDKKIFITGGTGFFGKWLLESFIILEEKFQLNLELTILSRDPESFCDHYQHLGEHPIVNFWGGDISSFPFPPGNFDYIIHAATDVSAMRDLSKVEKMIKAMVGGTRHLISFAKQSKAKKILFTSSGAVYGKQPEDVINISENYPLDGEQLSAYGKGKIEAEKLLIDFSKESGVELLLARCFAFVGPYLPSDGGFAIGNFIANGVNGEDIVVKGDGTACRSYLYAADLMIWLFNILFRGESCRAYNVGSDESLNISQIAHRVAAFFPGCHIRIEGQGDGTISRYVPSVERVKSELGLAPLVTLDEAIEKTIFWYQNVL